jgi:site-specific DNA recombinase
MTKPNRNSITDEKSNSFFNSLLPKKEEVTFEGKEVILYYRVSSKYQYENGTSIEIQKKNILNKINTLGAICIKEFGGTYESAASDYDRKEFSDLLNFVKKAKRKPFAIFVNDISRFSRTGGGSISIMEQLKKIGVFLYEVSTGESNITIKGELNIYKGSLRAREDNIIRTEATRPNIIEALENGKWIGKAPFGYDHFGKRVNESKRVSGKQKIIINKAGHLLKKAFEWKLTGKYSDVEIIAKLKAHGLSIKPQKISKIWRNPFYCGIIVSRYLTKAVKGNWEGLITEKQFIKLQEIIKKNPSGFKHVTTENSKILGSGFSTCSICNSKITAYTNKKKNIPYYKCRVCNSNANAQTTLKTKNLGLNDVFIEYLKKYSIPPEVCELVRIQTAKLFESKKQENEQLLNALITNLKKIESEIKQVKIDWGRGTKPASVCEETINYLEDQASDIRKEIDNSPNPKSNLQKNINSAIEKLQNIEQLWLSLKYEGRRVLQKTIFPSGIKVDLKNRSSLTGEVNKFIELTTTLSMNYEYKNKVK